MKLSVIVPVYNAESTLRQCVDSIVSQINDDIEIILVDDGSKDASHNIIDSYAETNANIIAIHKTNGGVSSARNQGLKVSSGDWIAFVDSDDSLCDGALITMYESTKDKKSDFYIFQEYKKNKKKTPESIITDNKSFIRRILCLSGKKEIWGNLYKGDIARGLLFNENLLIGEDLIFNIEFAFNTTKPIIELSSEVYCHSDNPNSIMHTKVSIERYRKLIYSAGLILDKYKLREEMFSEYEAFCVYNNLYPFFSNCHYPGRKVINQIQIKIKNCIELLPSGYARFLRAYRFNTIIAFFIFELTCIKKHGIFTYLMKLFMS